MLPTQKAVSVAPIEEPMIQMPNYIIALLAWVCNRIPKIRSDFLWQKRSCPRLHGTNKTKDGKRWHTVTICPKHFTATMSKTMSKTRPRHPRRGLYFLFRPLLGRTSFLFDHCQDLCVSNNNFVFIPSIFPMIIPADQKGLVSIISF